MLPRYHICSCPASAILRSSGHFCFTNCTRTPIALRLRCHISSYWRPRASVVVPIETWSGLPSGRSRHPSPSRVDVSELVEKRLRAGHIVADATLEIGIVAVDAGRDRLRRALALVLPEDADLLLAVVRHAERAAQRDPILRVPADDRILHVEVRVVDRGLDAAREPDARLREARLEAIAEVGHVGNEIARNREVVEGAFLEAQEARIALLDD